MHEYEAGMAAPVLPSEVAEEKAREERLKAAAEYLNSQFGSENR